MQTNVKKQGNVILLATYTICTLHINMTCFVHMQVQERAMEVYGSDEEMEKARLKKVERREKQQQKKFDKNVKGNGFQICHKMQQAQKQEQFCIFPGQNLYLFCADKY